MPTHGPWILFPEITAARQAVDRVSGCVISGGKRRAINPLFLHGPSGTGKTRLAQELVAEVIRRRPVTQSAIWSGGDLVPLLAGSIPDPEEWRDLGRVDLLVIDDVQHLPARVEDAFTALLDRALTRQQQLVCTALTGPAQLTQFSSRVTSRLAQGVVVGFGTLSAVSRRTFLHQTLANPSVPSGLLDFLADHLPGSLRLLEGAIVRLRGLHHALGRWPTVQEVQPIFQEDMESSRPTVERIAREVGRLFQVKPDQMRSRGRSRQVMMPRQVSMYLARRLTDLSLEQIGAYFGGRDHSTVLHACRKVEEALDHDAGLGSAVRQLTADLG